MGVEDSDRPSLADQMLDDRNHRALAQIVGIFLEGQAVYADLISR